MTSTRLGYCQVTTPAGELNVVVETASDIVVAAGYETVTELLAKLPGDQKAEPLRQVPHAIAQAFAAYNRGQAHALDQITVRTPPSRFNQAVSQAMRQVTGTVSYGQLAALAGYPGAARAAGSVCSRNPVAVIVPCHRVVRADGSLGNYGYGLQAKAALLRAEGALDQLPSL